MFLFFFCPAIINSFFASSYSFSLSFCIRYSSSFILLCYCYSFILFCSCSFLISSSSRITVGNKKITSIFSFVFFCNWSSKLLSWSIFLEELRFMEDYFCVYSTKEVNLATNSFLWVAISSLIFLFSISNMLEHFRIYFSICSFIYFFKFFYLVVWSSLKELNDPVDSAYCL